MRPSGATWKPNRAAKTERPAPRAPERTDEPRAPKDFEPRQAAPLRVVRGKPRPAAPAAKSRRKARPAPAPGSERRKARGPGPKAVREELLRMGGPRGAKFYDQLVRAADALASDREKDALRLLRPLRSALPQSATVRELLGIALYRSGRYELAADELEAYVAFCGAVDQHPALMDCYRALQRYDRVEELWNELGQTASAPDVVAEGRIVMAGSLADRGRVREAIAMLSRRRPRTCRTRRSTTCGSGTRSPTWRSGPATCPARWTLFERISRKDAGFADVMERLVSLG